MNPWFRPKSKTEAVKLRPKRWELRYSVSVLSVRIKAELITSTRTYHGMLWDISARGACVQPYEPIPSGISCSLDSTSTLVRRLFHVVRGCYGEMM
jgi:hypothetical protein